MHSWHPPVTTSSSVHLLGVCGVGMAGVAHLLARRGWRVSGCDAAPNALAGWLRASGVAVAEGHAPEHLTPDVSRVVITPAVSAGNPELVEARARGISVFRRGEVLADILSGCEGVAVCGSHGKTTTSCFTAHLFQDLGLEPGWCIGGFTRRLGAVAEIMRNEELGIRNQVLVAEADESDGSLALYHPSVTVLTGIDWDHMEHFSGEEDLLDCFRAVVRQTRKGVAVCHDHPRARQLVMEMEGNPEGISNIQQGTSNVQIKCARKGDPRKEDRHSCLSLEGERPREPKNTLPVLTFGFSEGADVRATHVRVTATDAAFDVCYQDEGKWRVTLGVSGRHNILNALGAACAALLMGQSPERVFAALAGACAELPGRRFETVCEKEGVRVVADYAHHPQEIKAAVAMARAQNPKRLVVVFQPHRYSRTLALGAQFPEAFEGADEVILLPVYAASENPHDFPGGESCDLYAHFRRWARMRNEELGIRNGGRASPRAVLCPPNLTVSLARSQDEVQGYLSRTLRAGDFVLIAGAGDVIELADRIRNEGFGNRNRELAIRAQGVDVTPDGALSAWSFYGVGGAAQWRVEVAGEAAMAAVLKHCAEHNVPWRMFGAGANTWVSDLGMDGCAIRWADGACRELTVAENGEVTVGCGWRGPALLEALTQEGLSGLEFLEGVPGSVGGWLAMNAGAHGGEISARVKWVRCLDADGEAHTLTPDALGFSYRHCEGLKGRVAVSCCLALGRSDSATVKARRLAIREKRLPLAGLRTAGSVFRNPSGDTAGRLLDAAGCKALRIGGAYVTDFHANIIAVDWSSRASDVLALAQQMRARVERASGVTLELEISGTGLLSRGDAKA
ncbi:MAG: UDP-N-acetylmuramate dehydrogenase [Kiritimatiellaeota bacterium]|nr:UDP-N-acetylmuramate dehydrogenase [Kiritimatiellota bacterium]